MTRALSMDLRERAMARLEKGETCRKVASALQMTVSSVVKWSQRKRPTGSSAPAKTGGRKPYVLKDGGATTPAFGCRLSPMRKCGLSSLGCEHGASSHAYVKRAQQIMDDKSSDVVLVSYLCLLRGRPLALKHFVLTRIGLGIYNEKWFERMVALFLAVTAPSLSRQTCQDFHWLIVVDVALAGAERRALEQMAAAHPNFHIVTMDVTRMTFMRLGGHDWIWEPCHQYILETGIVEDPSEYVITSTIDADDAWATDYVALINTPMNNLQPEIEGQEVSRGSHLRHSNGAVLTFGQGLRWYIHTDGLEALQRPYHSMGISVLARLSSGLSALSNRHKVWPHAAEIAAFQLRELNGPHPMWLHVRHDFSVQPWQANDAKAEAASVMNAGDIEMAFGVDMEKVRAWRERYPGGSRHDGKSSADQYAQLFRLTGLNRQIATLEPRAGLDQALAEILARQRVARDELIARLREHFLP